MLQPLDYEQLDTMKNVIVTMAKNKSPNLNFLRSLAQCLHQDAEAQRGHQRLRQSNQHQPGLCAALQVEGDGSQVCYNTQHYR